MIRLEKRNTVYKRYKQKTSSGEVDTQFAEVPYTVGFSLSVVSRTMDDALQIVEQIVPYFTPEFTVTLNFSDMNTKIDVPIILNSVTPEIDYEGDTSTQRSVIFNLEFTALTYVFSPVKTQKFIKRTDVTAFNAFFNTGPTGESLVQRQQHFVLSQMSLDPLVLIHFPRLPEPPKTSLSIQIL